MTTKWRRPEKVPPKYPTVVVLKCQHCGRKFGWTTNGPNETPPQWCGQHKTAAKRAPKPVKVKCPTPHKRGYNNERAAIHAALGASRTYAKGLRSYRCKCGKYHTTSWTT